MADAAHNGEPLTLPLNDVLGHGHTVWLLTTGSGADGDEWHVESIHATERGAAAALAAYQAPQTRPDGSKYIRDAHIEEWPLLP